VFSSSPPLRSASQTTRAAFLLAVSLTSGQRSSPSSFPLEVSRFPPIQSRPRGLSRVSVRAPTFGVPKCRSRGFPGLVSLRRLRDVWVCRPIRAQSCSLCPQPVKASDGALSMCFGRHAVGRSPLGPSSLHSMFARPTRGRLNIDWLQAPLPCGLGCSTSPPVDRLSLAGEALPLLS
jgi:hypothetical protein